MCHITRRTEPHRRRILAIGAIFFAIAVASCGSGQAPRPQNPLVPNSTGPNSLGWSDALAALTDELTQSFRFDGEGRLRVAVLGLTAHDGTPCGLGEAIAEELTTRLFQSGRFDVIERRQLARLLEEHEMSSSDLLDPETVARLGRLVGAGGILTGTLAHKGQSYLTNARIILVESAQVVAAAKVPLARSAEVDQLGRCVSGAPLPHPRPAPPAHSDPTSTARAAQPPPTAALAKSFVTDFSDVAEGRSPEGWRGLQHMMVKTRDRRRCLEPFEDSPTPYQIVIPVDDLSDAWTLELDLFMGSNSYQRLSISTGGLAANFGPSGGMGAHWRERGHLLDTPFNLPMRRGAHEVLVSISREQDLFRMSIDGVEVALARRSGVRTGPNLVLEFSLREGFTRNFFRICEVRLTISGRPQASLQPSSHMVAETMPASAHWPAPPVTQSPDVEFVAEPPEPRTCVMAPHRDCAATVHWDIGGFVGATNGTLATGPFTDLGVLFALNEESSLHFGGLVGFATEFIIPDGQPMDIRFHLSATARLRLWTLGAFAWDFGLGALFEFSESFDYQRTGPTLEIASTMGSYGAFFVQAYMLFGDDFAYNIAFGMRITPVGLFA
jgi:hypothetical protein